MALESKIQTPLPVDDLAWAYYFMNVYLHKYHGIILHISLHVRSASPLACHFYLYEY